MLETIKRFAVERLEVPARSRRPDAATWPGATTRSRVWWFSCGDRCHPVGLDGLAALDADARAAAEWALTADGDAVDRVRAGIDLVNEMTRYWYRFGSTVVARRWQERALAALEGLPDGAGEVDSEATVTLLHGLAISMLQHADTEMSLAVVERSLSMAERLGRRDLQARALVDLGIGHEQICRPAEAVELFGRAAVLAREAGEARFEALAEANTALAFFDMGRYAEAVELGWRSLANRAALGDRWAACVDRINLLGALLMGEGPDVAQRWFVEWTSEVLALRDSLLAVNLLEVGAGIAAAPARPSGRRAWRAAPTRVALR